MRKDARSRRRHAPRAAAAAAGPCRRCAQPAAAKNATQERVSARTPAAADRQTRRAWATPSSEPLSPWTISAAAARICAHGPRCQRRPAARTRARAAYLRPRIGQEYGEVAQLVALGPHGRRWGRSDMNLEGAARRKWQRPTSTFTSEAPRLFAFALNITLAPLLLRWRRRVWTRRLWAAARRGARARSGAAWRCGGCADQRRSDQHRAWLTRRAPQIFVTLRTGTAYPPTTVDVRCGSRRRAGCVGARGARAAEPTDATRASPRSVHYKETIGDLKARVAAKTGVPVEKQQVRRSVALGGRA